MARNEIFMIDTSEGDPMEQGNSSQSVNPDMAARAI
jgi:hypothetical protein